MYDTIGRVQLDREMRQVASATPEVDTGFTADQGQQLEAAAASGQYDVTWDPSTSSYKVAAKSDPSAVGTISQGPRTTFQGKTVAGTMDDAQVSKARQLAMAGVLERNGRLDEAGRIRDRMAADEDRAFNRERARTTAAREDWRFGQETKKAGEEDAYRTGMSTVIDGSVFGQRSKAFQEAMGKYESEKKAYDAKVAAGEAPGLAPTPPMQPSMTSAEKVLDAANVIAYKAKHGKASPEELMQVSQQMVTLGQEGYLKMLQMAQQGAPLTAVVQAYNAQGKGQLDPSAIIEDKTVDRPGGVKSRLITYRLPGGGTQTIDSGVELDMLGQGEKLLKQAKQAHDMRMQEGQLKVSQGNLAVSQADSARRGAESDANAPVREGNAEIARLKIRLAQTEDPAEQKKIQEKLQALSTGSRGGGAAQNLDTAQTKNAKALATANPGVPESTIVDNVISQPAQTYKDYFEAASKNPMTMAKPREAAIEMMEKDGWTPIGNGLWQRKGGAKAGGGPAAPGAPTGAPTKGAVVDGFEFLGGNPNDQKNWRKAAPASPAAPPSRPASAVSTGPLPTEAAVRQAAALSPAEQARSDAYERSPANLRELQAAIASERDPAKRSILVAELRKLQSAQLAAAGA